MNNLNIPNDGKTYDVVFNDSENSNSKGFKKDFYFCLDYIKRNNGSDNNYFSDYHGGTVSIVCNETGETVLESQVL